MRRAIGGDIRPGAAGPVTMVCARKRRRLSLACPVLPVDGMGCEGVRVRVRRAPRRKRGAASPETFTLIATVALAGLGSLTGLGLGFGRAIAGSTTGAPPSGSAASTAALGMQAATGNIPAAGPTTPGIDVSYYQGDINWDAVAGSDIKFAYVRVSDGVRFVDPKFDRNWSESGRVGLARGAYQFFRGNQDPIAQAKLFVEKMGPLGPNDLPPMLDIEAAKSDGVPPDQLVRNALAWADYVEKATGKRPIIYTGYYFWNNEAGGSDAFRDYDVWIANYSAEWPLVPDPWQTWTMFQHTSSGQVPGIAGNVDMNLFNGDMRALDVFAQGGAAQVPPGGAPSVIAGTDLRALAAILKERERRAGLAARGVDTSTWTGELHRGLTGLLAVPGNLAASVLRRSIGTRVATSPTNSTSVVELASGGGVPNTDAILNPRSSTSAPAPVDASALEPTPIGTEIRANVPTQNETVERTPVPLVDAASPVVASLDVPRLEALDTGIDPLTRAQ